VRVSAAIVTTLAMVCLLKTPSPASRGAGEVAAFTGAVRRRQEDQANTARRRAWLSAGHRAFES
jgi:hypothetical protein